MSMTVLQLTTKDMMRARAMLKEQAGLPDTDPWDIIDPTGDEDLRRTLVIWCVQSRTNPDFTWEQAWDTPIAVMFPEAEAEAEGEGEEATPPTPGTATEPSSSGPGGSENVTNGKKPAAKRVLNSSTTSA